MIFKIHFEHQDGTPDYFVISGDTIKDIQRQTDNQLNRRNGKNPWSEEIV